MRVLTSAVPLHAALRCVCVASLAAPAAAQLPGDDILLIPNSGRDSISACRTDGTLLSLYYLYLPAEPGEPSPQPIQVVDSGTGNLLVTDEVLDRLAEFTTEGTLVRVLAGPQHGVHNAYSVCVSEGTAYFTAPRANPTDPALIWRVPVDGSAPPSVFFDFAPLGNPRGIIRVHTPSFNGFYVGDSDGDDIERITITGQALTPFHDSTGDGVTGIKFPQQLVMLPDGTLLAAGFSAPSGIYHYDAQGNQISYLFTISPRGVHPLPTNEYLHSAGVNLWAVDAESGTRRLIHGGQSSDSFRFITPWRIPSACPADLNASGAVDGVDLAALLAQWGTNGSADLNGDGTVSGADLTFVLSAWGPC